MEELRSRRSQLSKEIEDLIANRDRLYGDFQVRMSGTDKPTEDEVSRFEARRDHTDIAIRPTASEVAAFEARQNSGPSDEDVRQFNAEHAERRSDIRSRLDQLTELDEKIQEQLKLDSSRSAAERASISSAGLEFNQIERQKDPLTYREDNQNRYSYFLDLAAMTSPEVRSRDHRMEGFEERLTSHAKELADLLPARWSERKARAERSIDQAENEFRARVGVGRGGFEVSPFERRDPGIFNREQQLAELEQRAPSRIVGQGGFGSVAAIAA
jgi:hypothetical protein